MDSETECCIGGCSSTETHSVQLWICNENKTGLCIAVGSVNSVTNSVFQFQQVTVIKIKGDDFIVYLITVLVDQTIQH
jgi:outer membrane lipoprotein SlyB